MKFFLYNSLTKTKQEFFPLNKEHVKMYVCGPTVYDLIHLGNARASIVYDLLYRILIYLYGDQHVTYVRNITDIDDKIIQRAQKLNISTTDLTKTTIKNFHADERYLNCLIPDHQPKATEYVKEMIQMISVLISKEYAYVSDGQVYFAVKKLGQQYTHLSGRKYEDIVADCASEAGKISKCDFVLWKSAKNNERNEDTFDSPWGKGRPGWHIECSAMSHALLGKDFDIHGGGVDLIFPHHTNEIAQSTAAFPGSKHAKYWVHSGFLTHGNEKMSKSLNNFVTVQDLRNQGVQAPIIRLMILNTHYRKPLHFSMQSLAEAKKKIAYIYKVVKSINSSYKERFSKKDIASQTLPEQLLSPLLDDMNSHLAIEYVFNTAKQLNKDTSRKNEKLAKDFIASTNFLGFLTPELYNYDTDVVSSDKQKQINKLLEERKVAKEQKNWKKADDIRNNLEALGIRVLDNIDGSTTWEKIKILE
ncbi:cysteine--tRNA ligase [Candidatus Sneabacter namystus]|uniref:Cysteine--tRNA ligase n=1 Tax=Candidatus Sneabacter namystus TaxID=2601646 RepID=A0A5C0UI25_9RICK|nr:cysteine--tRNA ligase [Candidatus Sneabacter namystus]QEK39409.1 cysteine--tRNA ligase [Candidatus Sneabacter namystus]